ncbi:hypothetical protein [Streptomyces sp. NBC_00094]|uniref:hypothetical protein n=1 Tax=Streptomyces sp. NBC_00094 TaxID=2903620 RepID=UPI0022592D00|nr:hypothetical protein [Streptomyces sp. NBC_00094]MCX5395077.1 hypothetical protein [Streptomyces sp. NBC_00094]
MRNDALLPAEPYEAWGPLASLLYGHPPGRREPLIYVNCTRLMRASPFSLWVRLRELLAERGLTISTTVLVYLFPDGGYAETGVVLSDGGRVYEFDIGYSRMRAGSERNAVIENWHDITSSWQTHPFRSEIADAFIWRPPARRT